MKSEPNKLQKTRRKWIIDESKCLSKNEVLKLIIYCNQAHSLGLKKCKYPSVRNWFMIELGLNAGLRVSEMAGLQHKNLIIDDERSSISLIGKGDKRRTIWISSNFKKKCLIFTRHKEWFGFSTDPDSYLLNNLKGEKISKRALQKFFKQILKRAGLPGKFYIHCLRHTYSTFLLCASNHDYRFVQKQLGHASIITTQIYANVIESEARKAIEKMYK